LAEYNGSDTLQRTFIYGNYIDEVLLMKAGENDYYYVHDHLYSPAVLAGSSGTVLERYEYDAYGNPYILDTQYAPRTTSLYGNPYLFTGRRVDILDSSSLKIQYNRNRYYDYYTGRWLTHDPRGITINPEQPNLFVPIDQYGDGMSLYEYTGGQPQLVGDPMGLTECDVGVPASGGFVVPGGPYPTQNERQRKLDMYRTARYFHLQKKHWREMLDNWYCENAKSPITVWGIEEECNKDIADNSGFLELLEAWVAKKYCNTELRESGGYWSVDDQGFFWRYYWPIYHAGGGAAYEDATDFLGSYTASLSVTGKEDCKLDIDVVIYNKTGWESACRTLGFIGSICDYSDHKQREGPYNPSRGGDFEQYYIFGIEGIPIKPTCSLCKPYDTDLPWI